MNGHVARLMINRRYVDYCIILTDEKYLIGFFIHLNKIHQNVSPHHDRENDSKREI